MGEAARTETLKWNWRAATSLLRNVQYTLAERRFNERRAAWLQRLRPFGQRGLAPG